MPGPQRQPDKYDAIISGMTGGGPPGATALAGPYGGGSVMDVGNDNGRGPGTPGGMGTGSTGMRPSNIGVNGGGYSEADLAIILRGMPPERIAAIQRQMQQIGLLPENYRSFGFVDSTMRNSFAELLEVSNGRDSNYQNTLDALTTAGSGALAEERKEQARRRAMLQFDTRLNTYETSDPAGVRQTAEAAFKQALGRKPKKDELDRFVSNFLGNERAEQAKLFSAQDRLAAEQRDRAIAGIDADVAAASGQGGGVKPAGGGSEADVLWERVQQMIADSPYEIRPGKRTRSYAEQVAAKEREKRGGPKAATPGTSKHGDGRANDLQYSSPAARKWALENAHKYGLHFPIYNPKLPRRVDESWHVELKDGHSVGDGHDHGAASGGEMSSAPISEDITVQRQDLGAQAVEYARNVNPDETAAYDIGQQFNSLLAILSKGVV